MTPPASCPLCGHEMSGSAVCSRCPLRQGCGLLCCPNCGYQAPDESKSGVVRLVRRLGRRRPDGAETLGCVPLDVDVEIASMDGLSGDRLQRLSAFGLVPGRSVRVLQYWPSPVLRIGQTELAVERAILDVIGVRARTGPLLGYRAWMPGR